MLRVVFSSSKVMINRSCALFSCFFTPLIFFRIEPILALEFQEEQPGIVSCTILSSAKATLINTDKKTIAKNTFNIFFIIHPVTYSELHYNPKIYKHANIIYKLTDKNLFVIKTLL